MINYVDVKLSFDGYGSCEILRDSLVPDDYSGTNVSCNNGKLEIEIKKLSLSSMNNTADDFMRCYEVSLKVISLFDVKR